MPFETPMGAAPPHPADELHAVRAEMKRLRAREALLRARLIATSDRMGDAWVAELSERRPRRIDAARLPLSARADPRTWMRAPRLTLRLRAR